MESGCREAAVALTHTTTHYVTQVWASPSESPLHLCFLFALGGAALKFVTQNLSSTLITLTQYLLLYFISSTEQGLSSPLSLDRS